MKNKVAVLVTAYNEANSIGEIINSISDEYTVYVIDDGSVDGTGDIARNCGAKVISLPVNIGQGAAVIVGCKVAALNGYNFVVKMDGDGQHDPNEIPKFIEALRSTSADIVIGSRNLGSNYRGAPLARRIFLSPLTWVLNRLTGYNLTDSMCGFRAFSGESLRKILPIFDEIIEPEYMASEMWIRFSKAGITVSEVPVHIKGRKHGYSYKGLFRYGWGVVLSILRTQVDIYRRK